VSEGTFNIVVWVKTAQGKRFHAKAFDPEEWTEDLREAYVTNFYNEALDVANKIIARGYIQIVEYGLRHDIKQIGIVSFYNIERGE